MCYTTKATLLLQSMYGGKKEVKTRIEELRDKQVSKTINQRAKYDKTSKSKDIIILAKDKKIKELEEENKKLKEQLEVLRGKLYEKI